MNRTSRSDEETDGGRKMTPKQFKKENDYRPHDFRCCKNCANCEVHTTYFGPEANHHYFCNVLDGFVTQWCCVCNKWKEAKDSI